MECAAQAVFARDFDRYCQPPITGVPRACCCSDVILAHEVLIPENRTMTNVNSQTANKLSIVSTVIDSALAFRRGRPKSGLLLLGAAVLSSRIPGLGTAVSVFLRLVRRLR